MKKILNWLSKTEFDKWYDIPLMMLIIITLTIAVTLPILLML